VQCVILCAGFATRLRPLTLNRPKHLLPVGGRPMLDHLLDSLATAGVRSAAVVTNHKFAATFNQWASGGTHAVEVRVVDDGTETNETRLGAVGDLRFGLEAGRVEGDFLVVAGDNLFSFPIGPVFDTFRRRGNTIALYDVASNEVASRMGIAACDSDGRITDFVEKPAHPPSTLVSIGIYLYRAEVRGLVSRFIAEGNSPDKIGDFVAWLYKRTPVYGHRIAAGAGVWYDIGSFDQFQEANIAYGGRPIDVAELERQLAAT
jgi:glucose-1-phosphate thymidylyltransferase